MTVPVARRNLFAEKGRFVISVAGVAFAVLLILIVVSLYRGWSRSGEVFTQLPGELWVTQYGTSDPFHSISMLDDGDLKTVRGVSGVATVTPVLSRQMTVPLEGKEESVRFMALDFPPGYSVPAEIRQSFLPDQGQIIIEQTLSRKTGLGRGDSLSVAGVDLVVADVRPKGGDVLSQFAFLAFEDARQIFGVADVVNYAMVSVDPALPRDDVAAAIEGQDAGLAVFTDEGFARAVRKEIDESFIPVITILVAIGFIVGAAVVGLTIYTATIERAREFGVMKAVGASSMFLYRIVLSQSAIVTGAGFIVGLAGAMATARLAESAVPEFATDFQTRDVGLVFLATAAMALIASFMPVRRINNIDPAIVFRA